MEEGVEGDRAVVDRVRREVLRRQAPSDPIVAAWLDDDANVARFLRAEGGVEHAHKAVKRLVSMLAWMKEERPHELVCPACFKLSGGVLEASAAGHYMHVVTYDLMDRPTIYSCLELAANKDIDDNRKHLISTFETAIGLMPPGVEQWNWVLDMHGFRLVDCDPRLAKIFLSLAGERYPERLGNFWVVDAPGIFSTLWACVERFIDPVTKEKIKFVKTTDAKNGEQVKLRAALASHFSERDVEFFVREIADNRVKKRGEKAFCYREFAVRLREAYTTATNGTHHVVVDDGDDCCAVADDFLREVVRHHPVMPDRVRDLCDSVP